jgi:peptidoglycan/xylan/chitin deacetylase (PgdA/CDA1 family)
MRRRGIKRVKQWLRRATIPLRARVVILLYHRIFEASSDPWELCVSPKHFAEQLEFLRRNYRVLSLNELVNYLRAGRLPKRAVVLTFDDGYADNLWNAKPLLEKYQVPATVFVTSGYVDSPGEFWWDDLERILLQPKQLPQHLHMTIQGQDYEWSITDLGRLVEIYFAIHQVLQPLSKPHRDQAIAKLFAWANVERKGRPDNRPLSKNELIELSQSKFVEIGAHTVFHPFLSSLSPADQLAEIANSRRQLEAILGDRVDTFSYPYGNFTAETVNIVKHAGFGVALTVAPTAVETRDNLYRLGRFGVGDWGGEKFKRYLDEFFRT